MTLLRESAKNDCGSFLSFLYPFLPTSIFIITFKILWLISNSLTVSLRSAHMYPMYAFLMLSLPAYMRSMVNSLTGWCHSSRKYSLSPRHVQYFSFTSGPPMTCMFPSSQSLSIVGELPLADTRLKVLFLNLYSCAPLTRSCL